MSKKKYKTRKKNLPSVFNTSQVFTQVGGVEQQRANFKPKETGMTVNDKGDLVWKQKKSKEKPSFSMDINLGMIIWLILTVGLLVLHIWIWIMLMRMVILQYGSLMCSFFFVSYIVLILTLNSIPSGRM